MLSFLGVGNKRAVAMALKAFFENTVFFDAFQILSGNDIEEKTGQRFKSCSQKIFLGKTGNLDSLFSHKTFSFDNTLELKHAAVRHQRFITVGEKLITTENAGDVRTDFIAGLWMYMWSSPTANGKALILNPSEVSVEITSGVAGFGRCDNNWFHFLVETLPRILAACDVSDREVPIYVQDDIVPAGLEAILKITGRQVFKLSHSLTNFNSLIVGQGVSSTLESVDRDE
jgi:hypothetical protein